jgi:hypothetical protein
LARITADQARSAALAKVPGTVKSVELERGKLVFGVAVKTTAGEREVDVDAGDGSVLPLEQGEQHWPSSSQMVKRRLPQGRRRFICGMPSMNIDLEVEVLWGVGRNDPSEPQGGNRERLAERSGVADLRGDEQKSDMRRGGPGRAGH